MTGPTKCRSCGAEIVWAVTQLGKRMPVDVAPVVGGNLVLYTEHDAVTDEPLFTDGGDVQRVRVADVADRLELGQPRALWRSHFLTCPNADAHRARRTGEGTGA